MILEQADKLIRSGNSEQARELIHKVIQESAWTGKEFFAAKTMKAGSGEFIAKSPQYSLTRGEAILTMKSERSHKLHQALLDELQNQGWQPVLERRKFWFHMRLKRKVTILQAS